MPAAPEVVDEATRDWRAHADLLLRFTDEHMVFDGCWHVMAVEFYDAFSEWLNTNGHRPWSDQRFSERLRDHSAFVKHRLERRRVTPSKTSQQTLSRRPGTYAMAASSGQYTAWFGVRFRTSQDNTE